jgi:hypothetical protein
MARYSEEGYRMGMCDVFAIAAHRYLKKPLYVVRGYYKNKKYDPDLEDESEPEFLEENCHAVVKIGEDRYFDVDGIKEGDELMDVCYFENPVTGIKIVGIDTEEELDPYTVRIDYKAPNPAWTLSFVSLIILTRRRALSLSIPIRRRMTWRTVLLAADMDGSLVSAR